MVNYSSYINKTNNHYIFKFVNFHLTMCLFASYKRLEKTEKTIMNGQPRDAGNIEH
jgi:hypothetical protein